MKLTNLQNIGTTFKKENIFLATIQKSIEDSKLEQVMREVKGDEEVKSGILDKLIHSEIVESVEADLFYKDEKGYTRFSMEEPPETFVGDNTDGKGFLRNIVSVWSYYSEEEVKEVLLDDSFTIIAVTNFEPIIKYHEDFNG